MKGQTKAFLVRAIPVKDLKLLRDYADRLTIQHGVEITVSALIRQGIKEILRKGGVYDRDQD